MPKRLGYIYDKLLDKDQIRESIIANCKHKTSRKEVIDTLNNIEDRVEELYFLLKTESFIPSIPRYKSIIDKSSGKIRDICIVPFFPDSCVHRLVVDVMKPALTRGMYPHSCASIPDRGNAHAMRYVKRAMRNVKGTKYCSKLDIRHFYPNIQIPLVMDKLRRKIKDEKFLKLVEDIISVGDGEGLGIGFYINQWLANYILEELDWKIISADRVEYYVRNMDDMVLIGPNKRKLEAAVNMVDEELSKMGLTLKDTKEVFEIDERGIDFVGYRFFHDKTILRRKNSLKLMRQIRKVKRFMDEDREVTPHMAAGTLSMLGQLKHCNHKNFNDKHVKGLKVNRLKDIVRTASVTGKWS